MKLRLATHLICVSLLVAAGNAQQTAAPHARPIDTQHSTLTVRAFKTGLFSGFAHDHEVSAPITAGAVDDSSVGGVSLKIDARQLKVLDPKLEADKRAEVQQTMHSEKVLDSARFPEIAFASTQVQPAGTDKWIVIGSLTLHGQTHPVTVNVERQNGRYLGSAHFKQRDFGITPISIGGGTIKVKDEVKIEFEIVTQ